MAQSRARRPLSTAEAAMVTLLAYLILLISLVAARLFGVHEPTVQQALRPVAETRAATPAAAVVPLNRLAAEATCVGPHTVPYSYASAPGVTEPLAFGPPVEPSGPLSPAAVNGVLIQRLCGGPETAGGPVRAPDRRLFAAIDAAVNGTRPQPLADPGAVGGRRGRVHHPRRPVRRRAGGDPDRPGRYADVRDAARAPAPTRWCSGPGWPTTTRAATCCCRSARTTAAW